jgi:hypothetical protein
MLKIVGSKPGTKALVVIDPYVPLTIELGDGEAITPLYWRARAGDGSLVEVSVSPSDGSLHSITLTSISRERVVRSAQPLAGQLSEVGVPQVDTSQWPVERREFAENFVDQVVPLKLILGGSTATLCFSRTSAPISWQRTDSVFFGIAQDGFLCCIEVKCLSAEQLEAIARATDT